MRARNGGAAVLAGAAAVAAVVVRRRRRAPAEHVSLFFDDGSMIPLDAGDPDAARILQIAQRALAARGAGA